MWANFFSFQLLACLFAVSAAVPSGIYNYGGYGHGGYGHGGYGLGAYGPSAHYPAATYGLVTHPNGAVVPVDEPAVQVQE